MQQLTKYTQHRACSLQFKLTEFIESDSGCGFILSDFGPYYTSPPSVAPQERLAPSIPNKCLIHLSQPLCPNKFPDTFLSNTQPDKLSA